MIRTAALLLGTAALGVAAQAQQTQLRPDQTEFRGLYKELVETNTTLSAGSCTLAAERMAVRLRAAGIPASQITLFSVPEHPKDGGLVVVYPRVTEGERVLSFAAVDRRALVPAKYGLLEPRTGEPVVALSEIKLFVVPGVAFDRDGHRIGWGRGHYDATLAAAPQGRRIALAFECQIVQSVKHEAHDAPMHAIITEVATHVV